MDETYVSTLARLAHEKEMGAVYDADLAKIVEWFEGTYDWTKEGVSAEFAAANLKSVKDAPVEGVPPTSSPIRHVNGFREDVIEASITHEEAMMNAPDQENGLFKLPRVMERE